MPKKPRGKATFDDSKDEFFLSKCLSLALRGAGKVSPNPMVGCVIVRDGNIIGKGWHERCGEAHAEVNAIRSVKDESLLEDSTLYVNLEPCSHFGKTPPCVDLIIEKKIPRVVVGCVDPNPKVAGKGIKKLKEAGVEVKVGVLKEESEALNEAFLKTHRARLPFVALKFAQSLDGRIATKTKDSKWITSEEARAYAHHLRNHYDATMIGSGTALADNPELTVRLVAGRNPKRILLDRQLRVPLQANVFNADAPTLVFTSRINKRHPKVKALEQKGVRVFFVGEKSEHLNLLDVMKILNAEQVLSVMVEGGGRLFASLIKAELCDKLHAFVAPKLIGGDGVASVGDLGLKKISESVSLRNLSLKILSDCFVVEGYF
ncbi:MAG: bifunctional diaminohydroxyphosphoribosylaminopyrimidine deaminase/5-amino-6-(5-phosphoribosylamino)uracil reductase RibD [Chloroherpetonaceae bacterium]|nr:bifunctional diaminohydroxyphosphoribosylaminopyrimidine deaminase/5-amino-6-(5-phosphoribosylamino)uracil reductase RibD [Chloroherpetonaceae bacterium]MDW8437158.1 bifunctional diaminohydroxyphosphoribosylaminopyrimidine deaminase/5-amino-6-(5-phosphoribosylamino)uracil reductase RibD [Chloroherpetonaceae bacterium]